MNGAQPGFSKEQPSLTFNPKLRLTLMNNHWTPYFFACDTRRDHPNPGVASSGLSHHNLADDPIDDSLGKA